MSASERTRTLRGRELREYEAFWADWHAKYDRYRTRDGKHFLNSITLPSENPRYSRALCICHFEVVNAPDDAALLTAFQDHLDSHQPERIDLSRSPSKSALAGQATRGVIAK